MTQLALSNVGVDFGAMTLIKDVTFTVGERERWGIIGRNGTGKTTLFRLITGDLTPTRGVVSRANATRISLLEQHRNFGAAATVWEAAAGAFADLFALERSITEQANRMSESSSEADLERYGRDLERFEQQGGYTITPRIDAVLDGLGFNAEKARTTPLGGLSGGGRGRPAPAGRHGAAAGNPPPHRPPQPSAAAPPEGTEGGPRTLPARALAGESRRAFSSARPAPPHARR